MIDLRLAIPAATAWVTLILSLPQPHTVTTMATASGSAGLALVGTAVFGQRRRWRPRLVSALSVAALALVAASAVTVVAALTAPHRTPGLLEHRTTASVVGTVTAAPDRGAGLLRILVTEVSAPGGIVAVRMPVLVTGLATQPVGPASELPRIHDRVRVDGALSAADAGGDLAAFLTASGPVAIESRAGGLDGAAATLRAAFVRVAGTLPGDGAALLPGLSVGDTSAVGDTLDGEMTSAGLSHLTAVSGANCAVVVAAVLVMGALLRIPRLPRLGAAAAVLIGFVVLVTPEPSVLRAAVMAFAALMLSALGRPVRALPLVSLAVIALLLFDPWLARSFAFALSVLATTGLVVLAGPLATLLTRVMPEGLALALAVPLSAQLACQPLLLLLDPGVPVVGVVANLLAEPAAPVATVLGLVACLLSVLWSPAATAVAALAWLPATWIAAVARFTSRLPSGRIDWGANAPAILLAALLTVLVGAVVLTTPYRRSRRVAVAGLLVVALPLTSVVAGREVGSRLSFPADWRMAQCDVGQGDAVLLRSKGRTALVDTGDDEALLDRCLQLTGVDRLDVLVLTHFDQDHVGAAPLLRGRVETLLVGPTDGAADERLVRELGAEHVVRAEPGLRVPLGELALDVLWPPEGARPGNEASVVLGVGPVASCALCLTALMLGDLGETEQRRLQGRTDLGPVDVVKVSHHGSRDQSPALYEAVRARVALIGVGAGNPYGHPTEQTIRLLERTGSRVLRSDRDGTVALSTEPGEGEARIDVWQAGARASAAGRASVSAAASRLAMGQPCVRSPEEDHGCQGIESRPRDQGARGHRPGLVGSHPAGAGRPRLGPRAVPGRPRRPSAARPAHRRRPQPRGQRSRGRPLRPG